jgi:hypothetical protein
MPINQIRINRWGNGFRIVQSTARDFNQHPILIVPMLLLWVVYLAVVIVYVFYPHWLPTDAYGVVNPIFVIALFVICISILPCVACLLMLEIIQQIERGERANLVKAFFKLFSKDLLRALPIMVIWAAIWLILNLLELLVSNRKGGPNAALIFLDQIEKGVRMLVFLTLPAIAWDNKGPFAAIAQGITIIKRSFSVFTTGFALTELIAIFILLPSTVYISIMNYYQLPLTNIDWIVICLYSVIAWTLSIFAEQIFTARYYLWYQNWQQACTEAKANGQAEPALGSMPIPEPLRQVLKQ